jgi:hypothetical protein
VVLPGGNRHEEVFRCIPLEAGPWRKRGSKPARIQISPDASRKAQALRHPETGVEVAGKSHRRVGLSELDALLCGTFGEHGRQGQAIQVHAEAVSDPLLVPEDIQGHTGALGGTRCEYRVGRTDRQLIAKLAGRDACLEGAQVQATAIADRSGRVPPLWRLGGRT